MPRADRRGPAGKARAVGEGCLAAFRRAALVATAALLVPASAPAAEDGRAGPKRVVLIDSFGRNFSPYNTISSVVRTELVRGLGEPVDFVQVSLESGGVQEANEEALVDYLRALCARRAPDLVITNGGPAVRFFEKYRQHLLPGVPAVHGGPDERWLKGLTLDPDETAVAVRLDIPALLQNILRTLPRTQEVVAVFGETPLERFWADQIRREWTPFGSRVRLTFWDGLTFEEMVRRAATLRPDTAVFFGLMISDAAGIPYEYESAFERFHAASHAPVFGWSTITLGRGSVGGPLLPVHRIAQETARSSVRVLRGERPGSIRVPTIGMDGPFYDARELERWHIDEKRLPPGSEVRFRPPSFFQAYRGRILAAAAVLFLQAVAIAALVVGHRRQRRAEQEAARLRRDVAHVGRVTVLGQLASSLAHELAQPLGAILRNAEAAEIFLAGEDPDLDELRAIVADIKADDHRARDVIEGLRNLLRRREPKRVALDAASLVDGALSLVRPDARARGVRIETTVARDLPAVTGDPVHLQQVLLNLFVNAMEAMESTTPDARLLCVDVRSPDPHTLEIAVRDTGPGIAPDAVATLFEPFRTTKREGMGMGLAISRTLVEAHGGSLRAEAGRGPGATFVVTLPAGEAAG